MQKKKIGILTFQNTTNYGAELQKYALVKTIEKLGIQVEVINYICEAIEKNHRPLRLFDLRTPKEIAKYVLLHRIQIRHQHQFVSFAEKYIPTSTIVYTRENISQANEVYDLFVAGSDQIWNSDLTMGDPTYLLDFATNNNKKNAYAASFGYDKIPMEYKASYQTLLREFATVTVREHQGKMILNELGRMDVQQVLDPTLLLTRADWNSLCDENFSIKKDYVLVYLTFNNERIEQFARKLAVQHHLNIIWLHRGAMLKRNAINLRSASPEQFLRLVRDARYVVSGSFHAVCFSLIFQKDFFFGNIDMKKGQSRNSRLQSLMDMVRLEDRVIKENVNPALYQPIDYRAVSNIIENQRAQSLQCLKRMISSG